MPLISLILNRSLPLIGISLLLISCSNEKRASKVLEPNLYERFVYQQAEEPTSLDVQYHKVLKHFDCEVLELQIPTSYGDAHVLISGDNDAPKMVLLHGLNASSTMWYPNVKSLSRKFQVFCIDLPGEPNLSTVNREISDESDLTNFYRAVFDSLELNNFHLVGASKGGWIATSLAINVKDRFSSLTLLSPAQTFTWLSPSSELLANVSYSINPDRKKLRKVLSTLTSNVDQLAQDYIDFYALAVKEAGLDPSVSKLKPFEDNELMSISIPVLLIIGDQDIFNSDNSLLRAKSLMKSIDGIKYSNCGHFVNFDQAQQVNDKIIAFSTTIN